MLNYLQKGKRLAVYNSSPSATLLDGVPVVVSGHIRIPVANIPPLSAGECSTDCIFVLPAKSADTWNDGDTLYWDATAGNLTVTPTANAYAGVSVPMATSVAGAASVTFGKGAGVTLAAVALMDHNETVVVAGDVVQQADPGAPAAATATAPAAQTQDALTLTGMTGAANTSPAAETNVDTLTDSNGASAATTLDQLQAGGTGAAAGAWDTSAHRDAFIASVGKLQATLVAELALQKALNTVLINDAKTAMTELNKAKADVVAHATQITALVADAAALRSEVGALRTALIAAGVLA